MTSVFNIPFVVRIHVNLLQQYIIETSLENTVSTNNSNLHFLGFLVFPKLISAVNLESSCQFVGSVLGIPFVVRIHAAAFSNMDLNEQYFS